MLTKQEKLNREKIKKNKPLVYDKTVKFKEKYENGESIAIIQLHYDYKCNFKCTHCSISDFKNKNYNKNAKSLDLETVRRVAKEADDLGLAHFDITGGEPTLFSDMKELVEAIDPSKFYIQCDTNGWLMTKEKAEYFKSLGIDKIQLSLDSLDEEEHDSFRHKKGSYKRAIESIDIIKNAGLEMHISTVVTHSRARSEEFLEFLDFVKSKDLGVSICFPKPVGEWANKFEDLITREDIEYIDNLSKTYNVFNHLTPGYGIDAGCIAVKRMISITMYGDVLPCPWMYFSLGNVFDNSLETILKKGMKYFEEHQKKCLVSEDLNFINKYISQTYDTNIPVPIEKIMPKGKYEI